MESSTIYLGESFYGNVQEFVGIILNS